MVEITVAFRPGTNLQSDMDGGQLTDSSKPAKAIFRPLSVADPAVILQRWASGETLKAIGAELGVNPPAISEWLQRNADRDAREAARELHYETRLDDGLESLAVADSDANLARAREALLRRLEWRAETECAHRWGKRQQIDMRVTTTDLGDRLRAAKERVVGAGSTVADAQQNATSAVQQLPIAQDLTSTSK